MLNNAVFYEITPILPIITYRKTYIKSWAGSLHLEVLINLLIIGPGGLQCETKLQKVMGWESSDVVRCDLGPLLQGQTRTAKFKSAYNLLIIGPRRL